MDAVLSFAKILISIAPEIEELVRGALSDYEATLTEPREDRHKQIDTEIDELLAKKFP